MLKFIFRLLLILLVLAALFGLAATNLTYSEGERAGNLMKFSKKGLVLKTYEGQLDVGGLMDGSGDGAATTIWEFSVTDKNVINDIQTAMHNGDRVVLYYKEKFFKIPIYGDTKYFVYKVKNIKNNRIN